MVEKVQSIDGVAMTGVKLKHSENILPRSSSSNISGIV
jgi:hypothetical protein